MGSKVLGVADCAAEDGEASKHNRPRQAVAQRDAASLREAAENYAAIDSPGLELNLIEEGVELLIERRQFRRRLDEAFASLPAVAITPVTDRYGERRIR